MIEDKYLHDWSGTRYGVPAAVELPRSDAEVALLLKRCHRTNSPVAVQGGRTGVSGGAAPGDGEIVLSLERLDQIDEFDRQEGVIVVGSGAILENVQRTVELEGWSFPIDLASRGTCQIGGNVATNAGGSRVIKYGNVRDSVLGLEAVLADGTQIGPANRLVKNNAGYSLSSLLIGSEGTLGVVTRVALRLVPTSPVRRTALLALPDTTRIDVLLARARKGLYEALSAFEVMWPDFMVGALRSVQSTRTLPAAFENARAVLIEVEGHDELAVGSALEHFLMQAVEEGLLTDVVMSSSTRDALDLWAVRESVGEIQSHIRPYAGFDLGLSAGRHDAFVESAKQRLDERLPGIRSFFFGHAGDGNLHALIGPCPTPEIRQLAEDALYEQLEPFHSSVTAEHGIGRKKKRYLVRSRTAGDIDTMKKLKAALDPKGILNPGRVFDAEPIAMNSEFSMSIASRHQ